jgi:ABC-type transport system substrate-binding protein
MFDSKKLAILVVLLMVAPIVLAACGPTPEPEVIVQTVVVEQTKIVEKEGKTVTQVETVVVEVTAPPPPTEEVAAPPVKDTLVVCMSQEPDTLYFVTSNMAVQRDVYNAYNDMASASDTGYWFYTELLEKLPTLEDGDAVLIGEEGPEGQIEITYKVRDGIFWHDGEPLKASDFKYSYDVQMDPESGVTSRGTLEKVESFEVVDDLTFKVTLKKGIMDPMYGPYYVWEPLPQHVLGEMTPAEIIDSEYSRTGYPGTGPFVFEE